MGKILVYQAHLLLTVDDMPFEVETVPVSSEETVYVLCEEKLSLTWLTDEPDESDDAPEDISSELAVYDEGVRSSELDDKTEILFRRVRERSELVLT